MLQALDDDVEGARRVRAARALYERDYSPAMYREKMRKLAELMR
jgi:hypothetical protein